MVDIKWINAQEKAAGMSLLADRVGTHHVHDWAEDVAAAGETTIEAIARVDRGYMQSSVGKMSTAMGGVGIAEAGYGLNTALMYYTKFQEHGTRHGIMPMNSIVAAYTAMEKSAADDGTRMMQRINGEWNSI